METEEISTQPNPPPSRLKVLFIGGLLVVGVIAIAMLIGKPYYLFLRAEEAFKKIQCNAVITYYEDLTKNYSYFAKREPDIYYHLGVCYIGKDMNKARPLFEKLVKEYPNYVKKQPDLYYNLGFSYIFKEKTFLASGYFSKFLALNPKEEYIDSEMRFLMGAAFADTGKYYQAIKQLEKIPLAKTQYKIDPVQYYLSFARAYLGKNKLDKAIIAVDETLRIAEINSPEARKAHLIKFLVFRHRGEVQSAEKEVTAIAEIGFDDLDLFEADQYQYEFLPYVAEKGLLDTLIFSVESSLDASPLKRAHAYSIIAEYYQDKKDTEKAVALLQKAIEADPDYFWSYYTLGNIISKQEKWEESIKFDEKLVVIDKHHPFAQNAIGWSLYNIGKGIGFDKERLEKAREHLRKALEADPEFPEANNNLGLVYRALNDDNTALVAFQKAIQYNPKYKKPYLNIGSVYLTKKDYERALEYYNKALEVDPQFALALQGIGNIYLLQNKYQEAIRYYQQANVVDPKLLDIYELLAEAYEKMDQFVKAEEQLKKGVTVNDKHAAFYIALSNIYKQTGRQQEADESFTKGVSLQKKGGDAYYFHLGLQLKRQKKYKEAEENFKKTLALSSAGATSAHFALADLYHELARYDEAIQLLQEVLKRDSHDIDAYDSLGTAYSAKGDKNQAIEAYKKGLTLDLSIQDKKDLNRIYENLGLAYYDMSQLDLAIDAFKGGIEADPNQATLYVNLGATYDKKGMLAEAIAAYQNALRLDPRNALTHNNLGYIYAQQGRINEAIVSFKKALELDPNLKIAQENLQIYQKN